MSALLHTDRELRGRTTSVPAGAVQGDVLGCGLDYATGDVFVTRNGQRLAEKVDVGGERGGAPLMHQQWSAFVAARGDVRVRVHLATGAAAELPLVYDLARHEEQTWRKLRQSYQQKRAHVHVHARPMISPMISP